MKNNYVLGISLGNNTSVALVNNYGVKFAISEERLNNVKNTKEIPLKAFKEAMEFMIKAKPTQRKLDVVISHYEVINDREYKYFDENEKLDGMTFYEALKNKLSEIAKEYDIEITGIKRVDHHTAHRLPAYLMSGFALDNNIKCLSVTYDGFGDGRCATIFDNDTNEIISQIEMKHSLALVYQFITGCMGFKEHQHEGKLTGLAAFGKPMYIDDFRKVINYSKKYHKFVDGYFIPSSEIEIEAACEELNIEYNPNIISFNEFLGLKMAVRELYLDLVSSGATREDIAASLQIYCERLILEWLFDVYISNYSLSEETNITLSGGFFANVKINKAIMELSFVREVFVLPPMGDEGTSIGAGIYGVLNKYGVNEFSMNFSIDDLYLGKKDSNKNLKENQVVKYLIDNNLQDKYTVEKIDDTTPESIADYLGRKKIICISRGNLEFGPRALCNHTILYDATEKETNSWLNERLNRTEFMPFAPVTLDVFADDLYHNLDKCRKSAKYMTIAVDVTEEFKDNYRAAYHIDFTARPQILSLENNPFVYDIMMCYYENTGKKTLINTSFNLHNYPIVYKDEIALDSFIKADLDMLVLDEVIIIKRK